MASESLELSVSDFVALLNQTLEIAYPNVTIVGELANYRVNRGRWVYFDLKDEFSSVKFFGTVYQLPGPLEDGMLLKVSGQPRLHQLYGFSVNVMSLQPVGEGSLRRAADLLQAKLAAEGLFDEARKRPLPYPPRRIGLITAKQSAAYADFIKVLAARWQGITIELIDVQVQGEIAPPLITTAIERFNAMSEPPDVLVLIRGGGSAEDLAAFSSEQVTRAVAASRVPTLAAIGHEIDLSLAELAADQRASTPSNAAELLVPDRRQVLQSISQTGEQLSQIVKRRLQADQDDVQLQSQHLRQQVTDLIKHSKIQTASARQVLAAYDPAAILRRGYAVVRHNGRALRAAEQLKTDDRVEVQLSRGGFSAQVKEINHA